MRGRSFAGAVLAVLISRSASAQQVRWSFKLGGGLTVPTRSYNTYVNEDWHGQLGAAYFPRGGKAGVSVEFNRSSTGIDQHFLDSLGATEGSSRLWSLTLNGITKVLQRGRIAPYVIGGAGYYNRTVEFNGATTLIPIDDPWWSGTDIPAGSALNSYSKNSFGVNAGAGVAYTLARGGAVFLEGRYHHAFSDPVDSQVLAIVVGVMFGF
jgi:opacity protein-like surface antigen